MGTDWQPVTNYDTQTLWDASLTVWDASTTYPHVGMTVWDGVPMTTNWAAVP